MARKKNRRPERKWKRQRMPKSSYLLGARQRLMNDVGPYFSVIEEVKSSTGLGIGFWALARMIFPVVEAVSAAIYRESKRGRPPVRLLRELGIKYPNLVWEMYRHTLMHNDEMATASFRGRQIRWGIGIGTGHVWKGGLLQIDMAKLYADFLEFLDLTAAKPHSKKVNVWVGRSFRFNTRFRAATLSEVLELGLRTT